MGLTGHLVVLVVIIQVIHSQSLFNPINNLPPPGQSGNEQPNKLFYPNFQTRPPTTYQPTQSLHQQRRLTTSVVYEAVVKVRDEDNIMKRRLDSDIDRYAANFDTPDPLLFSESPEDASYISTQSRIINWISRLLRKYNMHQSLRTILSSPEASQYSVRCPFVPPVSCNQYNRYRTVDGRCNNINNPLWGSAVIPFTRLISPEYESSTDRNDEPRLKSRNFGNLPNARLISTRFHEPGLSPGISDDSPFTMLLTVFGQFTAHDVTDRAPSKGYQQSVVKCCNQGIRTPAGVCDNIAIPRRDAFRQTKKNCLEFIRSLEVTDINCELGTREQLNQASSYIDGGAVYGATKAKSDSLREFNGGLLMTSVPNQLPISPPGNAHATVRGFAFYSAGDNRVNEFIGLIGIETLWVREHNRIAKNLHSLNPNWDDETIFQEARRIIIALIQHITYAEYLPVLLGPQLLQQYKLQVLHQGRYNDYNKRTNPGLTNSFATVAMRYGHSMLRTTYNLMDRSHKRNGDIPIDLKDTFFRPQTFLVNENPLMRGMASDPSKKCDRVFSGSAINDLYTTNPGTGTDLAASNVQRSREHGLPNYATFRRHFILPTPAKFDNSLTGFSDHSNDDIKKLKAIYSHAEDVDVFSAGVSEEPVAGGAVGPLFGNILAEQFQRLREGDRFWFETPESPQAFTDEQLKEIKKVTFARIMCNGYNFDTIQEQVFLIPNSHTNRQIPCKDIPSLNLNYWVAA